MADLLQVKGLGSGGHRFLLGPEPSPIRALVKRWSDRSRHQAVELPRVHADDLAHGRGGPVAEMLLRVLRGLGPDPVATGRVGAPPQGASPDPRGPLGAAAG